ncbi:MAG: glycosyltransferase family 4 protein [Rhodoferax sp.]
MEDELKILCLTDAFWPDHAGGISKTVLFETQGLLARGHELVAVSRRLRSENVLYERRGGYDLHRYVAPAMGSILGAAYPLATIANLPRLIRKLHSQYAFDVAYVNNVFQAAALQNSGCDIPMVYVFHASAYREIEIDLQQGKYKKLTWIARVANHWVRFIENKVLVCADAIVARSAFMHGEIHELYGDRNVDKTSRIPLGIDTDQFTFAQNTRSARQQLGLSSNGFILLTVRRLVARTGVENLVLAMKEVVNKFPDTQLLVIGKGYLEKSLQALVQAEGLEKNVLMLGFVSEELLPIYYQAADLFVLPTQAYEGFGLSTLEALASGTPVLATPVGANAEVLSPLAPELVMHGIDAESIGLAINQWLEHSGETEWRHRCRDFCMENFTRDQVCLQIESVLAAVAKGLS